MMMAGTSLSKTAHMCPIMPQEALPLPALQEAYHVQTAVVRIWDHGIKNALPHGKAPLKQQSCPCLLPMNFLCLPHITQVVHNPQESRSSVYTLFTLF